MNVCYIQNALCTNICYTQKWDYFLSKLTLHTKMCNVRTYVTHEYEEFCFRTYVKVRKYNMSEHKIHKIEITFLSKLMVHTKMCIVRAYVRHKYEMLFFSVQIYVTYKNIICPKLCYTWKYDVWCQNLRYIRYVHFSLLFQNLDLGIASAENKNCIWQSLCLDLSVLMCMHFFLSNCSKRFKR